MKTKSVESVVAPPPAHMVGDGFKVHNFFPGRLGMKRMSPFFLMDYGPKTRIPPSETPRGVGAHPHRGFETVTLAFHGRVAHHDSAGNSGIIGEGDVQWMTAGSGILHKEYHEKEFARTGGDMQMVQLWVNLPARDKMTAPRYQEIKHAGMGIYELPQEQGRVEVVAGEYRGAKGPAETHTPVQLYKARLNPGAVLDLEFPADHNTGLLVIEGAVEANGRPVPADHFALFANEGETIQVSATAASRVLVLSGEPIDEPIAAYGPFVMNTQDEIYRAVEDFQAGRFGRLE
jgi:redox-sensitive bicupin YhaK (pirin superfamily)